jgi:hypothetical protein
MQQGMIGVILLLAALAPSLAFLPAQNPRWEPSWDMRYSTITMVRFFGVTPLSSLRCCPFFGRALMQARCCSFFYLLLGCQRIGRHRPALGCAVWFGEL